MSKRPKKKTKNKDKHKDERACPFTSKMQKKGVRYANKTNRDNEG